MQENRGGTQIGPLYEEDAYGRKYHTNAYALLECMDSHSVNAVVTDPPYEINIENQEWDRKPIHIDWLAYQFDRVTKPGGHVFVFCSDLQFGGWYQELGKYFTKLRKFAWCKTNSKEGRQPSIKDFAESTEFALHASNEDSYFNQVDIIHNYIETGALQGNARAKKGDKKSLHPTQKPQSVLKHILKGIAREGDLILDPFAGTHSLAKAATDVNMHYITSDITPYYYWNKEL